MDPNTKTPATNQAESDTAKAGSATPKPPAQPRYKYNGREMKNPRVYNRYGSLKLRPWAMTDEEIDAVLIKRPDLKHLWTVIEAK